MTPADFAGPEPSAADLRAVRERVGTQDAAAKLLGCPQATLSRLETGRHPVRRWHVLALLYLAEHEGRTPWDTHTNGDER